MFRTVVLLCILSLAQCQYSRQRSPPRRPPPEYDAEPDYEDYQVRSQPQPPPASPVNAVRLRPASVHYVNIGAELAGDYKFGYDTGKRDDGQSFREETRLPDGSVQGAYGYVDETGKQRIVKYTAGKEGFKILKDNEATSSRPASQPAQPASSYRPPPAAAAPSYSPPPQPARAPPAPAYVPPAQPARAPARSYAPAPQPARSPPAQAYAPQSEPAYRAPPQPAYRAPPQPAYRPAPAPQRTYAPEPQAHTPPRSRSSSPRREYAVEPARRRNVPVEEPDYDYPDNDIQERRLVPIDTSLFNYNIGTNSKK